MYYAYAPNQELQMLISTDHWMNFITVFEDIKYCSNTFYPPKELMPISVKEIYQFSKEHETEIRFYQSERYKYFTPDDFLNLNNRLVVYNTIKNMKRK